MQQTFEVNRKYISDPSLMALLSDINEKHQYINYPIYRCAVKLNELKRIFGTENISIRLAICIIEKHGLNYIDNIGPEKLEAVLYDFFFAAEKLGHFINYSSDHGVDRHAETVTKFLWHVFDRKRDVQHISPIELKQMFLILCQHESTDDFVHELFLLSADHNCSVTRYRFETMLSTMSKLFTTIDSGQSFQLCFVPDIVNECFEQCPGIAGLNEYQFNNLWRIQSHQFANYGNVFMTMKRLISSEKLLHQSECVCCHEMPIEGLRFRCHQCRKVSLCFRCFCTGFSNKNHKPNHQMYEISSVIVMPNKLKSFMAKLCRCFVKETSNSLDNTAVTVETDLTNLNQTNTDSSALKFGTIKSIANLNGSSSFKTLASIIELLADENEKLVNYLCNRNASTSLTPNGITCDQNQFLNKHQVVLNDAISQLCDILRTMSTRLPYSSTPYRQGRIRSKIEPSDHLSKSIRGIDINKTYFENNRSDLSISDISSWFHTKNNRQSDKQDVLPTVSEYVSFNTDMRNFKELLYAVKDIIEDTYSDNARLSNATKQLETVLDDIIGEEERKREKRDCI